MFIEMNCSELKGVIRASIGIRFSDVTLCFHLLEIQFPRAKRIRWSSDLTTERTCRREDPIPSVVGALLAGELRTEEPLRNGRGTEGNGEAMQRSGGQNLRRCRHQPYGWRR